MDKLTVKVLGTPIGGVSEIDGDGDGFRTGPTGKDNVPVSPRTVTDVIGIKNMRKPSGFLGVSIPQDVRSVNFDGEGERKYPNRMNGYALGNMWKEDMAELLKQKGVDKPSGEIEDLENVDNQKILRQRIIKDITSGLMDLPEKLVVDAAAEFAQQFQNDFLGRAAQSALKNYENNVKDAESTRKIIEIMVNKMINQWFVTSNDDVLSAAMQVVVAEEFGLKNFASASVVGTDASVVDKNAREMLENNKNMKEFIASVLRQQYSNTQAYYEHKGIKEVILQRGFVSKGSIGKKLNELTEDKNSITELAVMRPLSSFTTDFEIADRFAYGAIRQLGRDNVPIRATITIPVSQIFSNPFTGMGYLPEQEIVVIGKPTMAKFKKANEKFSDGPGYYRLSKD